MAQATTTIRQLKNNDTGIDLAVTSIKEVKAMIGSAYEYEIMVVSNLACFKNAKHKETDNVQFTVQKKFSEFEELQTKLNTKYTGTVFPGLPKKVIKVSAQVAKDRRSELDQFLKFLAMTDKLSSCAILLEFLGISSVKASNFRKAEMTDTAGKGNDKESEENSKAVENDASKVDEDLFDDGDIVQDDDDDLFSDQNLITDTQDETRIFAEQDLGGALDEEDDVGDLFVPDAKSEVKGQVSTQDEEDNTDLLNIDEDLADLVKLSTKQPKAKQTEENNTKQTEEENNTKTDMKNNKKPALSKKPSIPSKKPDLFTDELGADSADAKNRTDNSKPTNQKKPNLPNKPKPALRDKPAIGQKPTLAKKPELKPKPKSDISNKVGAVTEGSMKERIEEASDINMNEDDILKYIQDNDENNNEDLDLFS